MIYLIANLIVLIVFNHHYCNGVNGSPSRRRFYDVENLSAEADYRAVKLKWNYYSEQQGLTGFKVKFCEISAWNSKIRCRERLLRLFPTQTSRKLSARYDSQHNDSHNNNNNNNNNDPIIDKLNRVNRNTYEANIYDLRMLTNYTFSVKAEFDPSQSPYHPAYGKNPGDAYRPHSSGSGGGGVTAEDFNRYVTVETKSFSAKTSRCLANTSDVVVNTGPYFNGKITVEFESDHRCSVYGNRTSSQSVYTLTILHDVCGSKIINNSRIETMVMVHENREILTHNSRRFLVVCNFVPETYTLTASVAVPPHLLKRKHKTSDHNRSEFNVIPVVKPVMAETSAGVNETSDSHNVIDKSNDIFTFDNHYVSHNVRDSRMLALHQDHMIVDSGTKVAATTNDNINKSVSGYHWNHVFSTILFVISGLIFCVIAILWFATTPRLSDKNREIKSYLSSVTTMTATSDPKLMAKNKAILTVNGSPVALVSIDSLGESFA